MNDKPKVWSARRPGEIPEGAVLIDRSTKWGNPIRLEDEKDRADVLKQFEDYLSSRPWLVAEVKRELKGKHLVCWCTPKACHGDVLLRVANE